MGTDKRERQKAGRAQRLEDARIAQQKSQRRRQFITFGVAIGLVVVVVAVSSFISSRNKDSDVATGTTGSTAVTTTTAAAAGAPFQYGTGPCPPAGGVTTPQLTFTAAPMQCIDPTKSYSATFETSAGTVKVALDTTRTPGTTNNFVVLSQYLYYNGTQIFRADQSIDILQGGAPHDNSTGDKGPGYTIPDEGGKFTYQPGQLVMARTQGANSAGAQFFFTAGPKASSLDAQGTYVVFGNVTEGLDVLQKVLATAPGTGDGGDKPNPPVTVNKVTITESAAPASASTTAPAAGSGPSSTPSSSPASSVAPAPSTTAAAK